MAELTQGIIDRLEYLERQFATHLGPQSGATSLNFPHTGVPYLNEDHEIPLDLLPVGDASTEVAAGDHTHLGMLGYYL